jgi:hypothetical protein
VLELREGAHGPQSGWLLPFCANEALPRGCCRNAAQIAFWYGACASTRLQSNHTSDLVAFNLSDVPSSTSLFAAMDGSGT